MPTVSVVIPTFNRSSYLPRAVDSILQQTYEDLELVVVDDASTDDTSVIMDRYDDSRIVFVRHETNRGANVARNTGIETARGKYISFLDSDDEFHPRYLEKVISRFESCDSEDVAGIFTSFQILEDGAPIKEVRARDGEIETVEMFRDGRVGTFSCVTFDAKIFDEVGHLDETLVSCQDFDIYIRVLKSHRMIGINEVLVDYYSHNENLSTDIERRVQGQRAILDKHSNTLSKELQAELHYAIADRLARLENLTEARSQLKKALSADQWHPFYLLHYIALQIGKRPYYAMCILEDWWNNLDRT